MGEHPYCKVFNSEFNLRFGLPRSATCDRLNLAFKSDPGDTVAHQQLADHQDKGVKGYQNMRGDNENNNDVLKYKRQLWTYVFGIRDMVVDRMYNICTCGMRQ